MTKKTRVVSNEKAFEINQRALSFMMEKHSKIIEKQTFLVGTFKDIFSNSKHIQKKVTDIKVPQISSSGTAINSFFIRGGSRKPSRAISSCLTPRVELNRK